MKPNPTRLPMDPATKRSLWWLRIAVAFYTLYILEGFTYLATDNVMPARYEDYITLGGYFVWLGFLNGILLLAARTVQKANLSFITWVLYPFLAHIVLLVLIFTSLEVNADPVFFSLFFLFCFLPQIYFFCLWYRILKNRRPYRHFTPQTI